MKRNISRAFLFVITVSLTISSSSFLVASSAARAADVGSSNPYSAEWKLTGPTGGDVRGLVVDPNDPNRFYFGTLDGQIYTSSDGARTWRMLVNLNRPRLFVDHIIVDPRNSKVLYVATHRHKDPGGFFKSTDGGLTWRDAPELRNEAVHAMTQSESNPNILLVGTINGIFRSMDSGETWAPLPTGALAAAAAQQRADKEVDVESLAIDPRNSNVIYAGTWWLPYKSTDGGQTWKIIKKGIIDDSDIFAINIDPRNADHIIASACSGIYETRDAGENWAKVQGIPSQSRRTRAILQHPSMPGLVFAGTTEGFWRSGSGGANNSWMVTTSRQLEINSIAVHPQNPNTVFIGTNNYGVMVSTDGGKNFIPSNTGFSGRFVDAILADRENPNRVYATTINTTTGGGFFFVSTDGGASWQPSMRNMPPRLIGYSILQDERDANIIYLGTNLGVYRSTDRGMSWAPIVARKPANGPARRRAPASGVRRTAAPATAARSASPQITAPGQRMSAPRNSDDTVRRAQQALERAGYEIGNPDGQLGPRTVAAIKRFQTDRYLSVTGQLDETTLTALGVSATAAGTAMAHVAGLTDPVNAMISFAGKSGPEILAATNSGLYRTSDPSLGWDRFSYGQGLDTRTTCISTSPQTPAVIFVGTTTSGVLVSRNSGESWQAVSGIPNATPVNVIVQDPQRAAYVYVGTKQAFYMSHDGGDHWTRRGGNLPFGDFTSILINPRSPDEIFVGNAYQTGEIGGGVYRSNDAGSTWNRIDTRDHKLPSQRIWALALDPRDQNTLYVGSHSAGIYVVPRGIESSATERR
ncbi:MAG TPA: peptidoglycan-binding protein [Pyrinomonadaceae bacterium]|nr:peptidoglycan-binding protein [Pyrinomonadaceae bacterium]